MTAHADTTAAMDTAPRRIVAFVPNWVGDAVMFTPALRAIHARFPEAELALLARRAPAAALTPNPWTDRVLIDDGSVRSSAARLRAEPFDLAVLGPNSFRSAWTARRGGVRRRVGYARGGRGWLLTDGLKPSRYERGSLAVTPALEYYLGLAAHLGCDVSDRRMELSVSPADSAATANVLSAAGIDRSRPVVLLNPGASFGPSKLYPPARFAAVADALAERRGAQIVVNAAPDERRIALAVEGAMKRPVLVNLARHDNSLGLLKAMVAASDLMITNDTGPRHFAAALGVPVVTIFGSTDPDWTTIDYERERIVRTPVFCGPCQRKRCPMPAGPEHHQCMKRVPPEMVLAAAEELLRAEEPA